MTRALREAQIIVALGTRDAQAALEMRGVEADQSWANESIASLEAVS
ncbi:hypothetical protein SAMN05877809_102522 [Rhodobacter sp. JA431]|nr:hypothetical protein SAMN05877809_102522 [Rhodobacter sp. JA431]